MNNSKEAQEVDDEMEFLWSQMSPEEIEKIHTEEASRRKRKSK